MTTMATYMINKLYEKYFNHELAINKSIIKITGLEPKKIFLKIKGEQWSCVIYTCSMKSAKIIMNIDTKFFELLKEVKNYVNLRLSFLEKENNKSVAFFIPSNVEGYKNFNIKYKNSYIINLAFTQKPSDYLIELLGKIIQEKEKFEKRGDERISLNSSIIKDIGFTSNNIIVEVDNIKRSSILRNISASGSVVLMSCMPKFIMNKKIILKMIFQEKMPIDIAGTILRSDKIEGRKDIYEIGIQFDKKKIPLEYKQILNNYFDKLEKIAKQDRK